MVANSQVAGVHRHVTGLALPSVAQGPVKLKTVLIAYRAAANPSKDEDARLVLWSDDAASLLTPIYIMNINAPNTTGGLRRANAFV